MDSTTYRILDKDHWEVMQMDPETMYQDKNTQRIGMGFFWMQSHDITREMQKNEERHMLWGKVD